MKTYIIDIDGTLADCTHRLPLIARDRLGGPAWDEFFAACDRDQPIFAVIDLIRSLNLGSYNTGFVYLTGRPARVRTQTSAWLKKYNLPLGDLLMRADSDHRRDHVIKPVMLAAWIAGQVNIPEIAGVFEDRPSVCRVWRGMGLPVFQVGSGEDF